MLHLTLPPSSRKLTYPSTSHVGVCRCVMAGQQTNMHDTRGEARHALLRVCEACPSNGWSAFVHMNMSCSDAPPHLDTACIIEASAETAQPDENTGSAFGQLPANPACTSLLLKRAVSWSVWREGPPTRLSR